MAFITKCVFCSGTVRPDERTCPHCGGANSQYVPGGSVNFQLPKTIGELQDYCAERKLPLEDLRFFIGQDYRAPKAFGIYRAGESRVVVYKNKSDGTRSVRYDGPDEAYAVGELLAKMLEEGRRRGRLKIGGHG